MINILMKIVENMKSITRLLKPMKSNQVKILKLMLIMFEIKNARNRFNNRLDVKEERIIK